MTLGLLPLRPLDASLDGFRNDALFNITMLMVSVHPAYAAPLQWPALSCDQKW